MWFASPAGLVEEDLGVTENMTYMKVAGLALAAVLAAACAGSGGSGSADSRGEFVKEAAADPGMGARGSTMKGAANADGFESIYFAFDAASLSSTARQSLRTNATVLQEGKKTRLEIQGNCDERGTAEYNLALGKRRAEAAKQYMIDLGIHPSRLTTISFGEENPATRGNAESAWARNRRDEFVIR